MSVSSNEDIINLDESSMSKKDYHLKSWKASGKKVSEYCKENDLASSTLHTWIRSETKPKPKFKQVKTSSPQMLDNPPKLLVRLGDTMRLYFHSIDDVASITKLLRELS